MEAAPTRVQTFPALTRSQRKVLADLQLLQDGKHKTTLSSRKLAELSGLSERAVRNAIDRLNELQLIRTYTGDWTRPSQHTVLVSVPVRRLSADSPQGGRS